MKTREKRAAIIFRVEVFLVGILNKLVATWRIWGLPGGRLAPPATLRYMTFGGDSFVTANYSGWQEELSHWSDVWDDVPEVIRSGLEKDFQYRAYVTLSLSRLACAVPGDFVELGTHYGLLPKHYLLANPRITSEGRSVWLFDVWGDPKAFKEHPYMPTGAGSYEVDAFEVVKKRFDVHANVEFVRGYVPETLGALAGRQIAYLSIDLNSAKPEREALDLLWSELSYGGVVYFDDLGDINYSSLRVEVAEFAKTHGQHVFFLPSGQAFLIKTPTQVLL